MIQSCDFVDNPYDLFKSGDFPMAINIAANWSRLIHPKGSKEWEAILDDYMNLNDIVGEDYVAESVEVMTPVRTKGYECSFDYDMAPIERAVEAYYDDMQNEWEGLCNGC